VKIIIIIIIINKGGKRDVVTGAKLRFCHREASIQGIHRYQGKDVA
jgi:hypothetical protein